MFYSVQRDEVYCKIRCPLERLKREAVSLAAYAQRLVYGGTSTRAYTGGINVFSHRTFFGIVCPLAARTEKRDSVRACAGIFRWGRGVRNDGTNDLLRFGVDPQEHYDCLPTMRLLWNTER